MGQRKSQGRKSTQQPVATRLDCRLERRLISYAVAATAAGVGALACSPLVEAKVVYVNTWIPIAPIASVPLDLNNDGIVDFQFSNQRKSNKHCSSSFTSHTHWLYCGTMKVLPQNPSNAIWGTNAYASALGSGVSVGSQGKFQSGHELMANERSVASHYGSWDYFSGGPWKETSSRFLGLKFLIQGQVYYGWARLNVTATFRGLYGAITGYAYETVPNTPILTGQENGAEKKRHKGNHAPASLGAPAIVPGSLGVLAGGSPSLQVVRARDLGGK